MSEPSTTALLFVECQRGVIGDLSVLPALAEAAQPALAAMADWPPAPAAPGCRSSI